MSEDTIWRDLIPANYLTRDYFEPGADRILTIKEAKHVPVNNPVTKKTSDKLVLYFEEDIPPMICNVTNARTITAITGTPKLSGWAGQPIRVYFDPKIKLGNDVKGGLRVSAKKVDRPVATEKTTPVCHDCHQPVADYMGVSGALLASKYTDLYGVPLCYDCGQARKPKEAAADA